MSRVFISVEMPDSPAMRSLRLRLRNEGIRTSPPEQTHITLCFIGDVPDDTIPVITECVRRGVGDTASFPLTVSGIGAFPDEKRPSVLWLGAKPADTISDVANGIRRELRDAGIPFDGKPFKPHVTIARPRDRFVPKAVFEDHRSTEFASAVCSEVLVMKSELGPKGAKHSVLARVPLARRGLRIEEP